MFVLHAFKRAWWGGYVSPMGLIFGTFQEVDNF